MLVLKHVTMSIFLSRKIYQLVTFKKRRGGLQMVPWNSMPRGSSAAKKSSKLFLHRLESWTFLKSERANDQAKLFLHKLWRTMKGVNSGSWWWIANQIIKPEMMFLSNTPKEGDRGVAGRDWHGSFQSECNKLCLIFIMRKLDQVHLACRTQFWDL